MTESIHDWLQGMHGLFISHRIPRLFSFVFFRFVCGLKWYSGPRRPFSISFTSIIRCQGPNHNSIFFIRDNHGRLSSTLSTLCMLLPVVGQTTFTKITLVCYLLCMLGSFMVWCTTDYPIFVGEALCYRPLLVSKIQVQFGV